MINRRRAGGEVLAVICTLDNRVSATPHQLTTTGFTRFLGASGGDAAPHDAELDVVRRYGHATSKLLRKWHPDVSESEIEPLVAETDRCRD